MTNQIRALYERAIAHFGEGTQLLKAMEESDELVQAVAKYTALPVPAMSDAEAEHAKQTINHLAEEIADVRIMLDQICMIYAIEDRAGQWRNHKLARLKERIDRKEGLDHREVPNDV